MNIRIGQLNHLAAELNSFYGQNHPVMLNVAVTEPIHQGGATLERALTYNHGVQDQPPADPTPVSQHPVAPGDTETSLHQDIIALQIRYGVNGAMIRESAMTRSAVRASLLRGKNPPQDSRALDIEASAVLDDYQSMLARYNAVRLTYTL